METTREFLIRFMTEQEYPQDAFRCFLTLHDEIESNSDWQTKTSILVDDMQSETLFENLRNIAKEIGTHEYTFILLYFMYCAQKLEQKYLDARIDHNIYLKSMNDLKCKLIECKNVYNVWGTFVGHWFPLFFEMKRFGLGRFQYERIPFPKESYSKHGFTVHKGDIVYNMHIPSAGPIPEDVRIDSYIKAYEFFRDELNDRPLFVVCDSWLLYKGNEDFLPENSNIRFFMKDFDIIDSRDSDRFNDAWRVFGHEGLLHVEDWHAETALQKAFLNRIKNNGKTGIGFGVLIFDGKKIIK